MFPMKHFDLFDAVRIVGLPEGRREIPVGYSQTETEEIKLGDIGVVLAEWPGSRFRVEAVREDGAIDWQHHCFEREHLEVLPATAANFSRRRINEHWAYQLALSQELLDTTQRNESLTFARKVMAFARRNVELLIGRLQDSGYQFANPEGPWCEPEDGLEGMIEELADRDVYFPIALQAWFIEVGCVDLSGTHPEWPRTAYFGLLDDDPDCEPWYTDPLFIWYDVKSLLSWLQRNDSPSRTRWLELAPDAVTKANISGGGPVSVNCEKPSFDSVLVGQHGSYTLLSYLRAAFDWSGFQGFEYMVDAPEKMLKDLGRGLTRL